MKEMVLRALCILMVAVAGCVLSCAVFDLSTVPPNMTLTLTEHLEVTVPFSLNTNQCPKSKPDGYLVYVRPPRQPNDTRPPDYCAVVLGGKTQKCVSHTLSHCQCRLVQPGSGVGVVEIRKIVTMEDNGTWVWKSGDGSVAKAEVTFHVLFHQQVTAVDVTTNAETTQDVIRYTESEHKTTVSANVTEVHVTEVTSLGEKVNMENYKATDNRDDGMSNPVMTGIIAASANLATIFILGLLLFFCRRRRNKRRTVARPPRLGSLPSPPSNPLREVGIRDELRPDGLMYDVTRGSSSTSHCYQSAGRPVSNRIYEEIPATATFVGLGIDDTYLTPAPQCTSMKEPLSGCNP